MNIREYYPYKYMKRIPEPVALFEINTSKNPPEPSTTYAGRYVLIQHLMKFQK
jgi:hypothetical protein